MSLANYFKTNKQEHWFLRCVKPIGWILFCIFLVFFILSLILSVLTLYYEFINYNPLFFNDSNIQSNEFLNSFRNTVGQNLFVLNILFFIFVISSFCIVLSRIHTKIWMLIRYYALYHSLSYIYHDNKKKLIISLIFCFLSIVFWIFIFLFVFFTIEWLYGFDKQINDVYHIAYNKLYLAQDNLIANNVLSELKSNLVLIFNNFNFENFGRYLNVYLVIGIVGVILLTITNSCYGLTVIFFKPDEMDIDFLDDDWNYLKLVDEDYIKSKKLKVGKPMSYSDYQSFITNGYSGKNGNIRDNQFDLYQKRVNGKE